MREFKQIDVRAIDLEALGVQIAYVMTDSPARKDACRRNARLIVAAQELLEALQSLDKRFRLCMEHCVTASEAYDSFYQEIVSEAIAKATGAA